MFPVWGLRIQGGRGGRVNSDPLFTFWFLSLSKVILVSSLPTEDGDSAICL